MKLNALACVLITAGLGFSSSVFSTTTIHQFEDGFVERSMAVIIRGNTAHVQYSVGLNDTTIRQLIEHWESPQAPGSGQSKEDVKEQPVPIDPKKLGQENLETSKPEPGDSAIPHNQDTALLTKFQKTGIDAIANGLAISCDGKPAKISSISAGPSRHPFCLVFNFEFAIPDSGPFDLKISDPNFAQQAGAVRYALKATGNSVLLRSNVAPILVRSDRIELGSLTKQERIPQTSISARVAVLPQSKK